MFPYKRFVKIKNKYIWKLISIKYCWHTSFALYIAGISSFVYPFSFYICKPIIQHSILLTTTKQNKKGRYITFSKDWIEMISAHLSSFFLSLQCIFNNTALACERRSKLAIIYNLFFDRWKHIWFYFPPYSSCCFTLKISGVRCSLAESLVLWGEQLRMVFDISWSDIKGSQWWDIRFTWLHFTDRLWVMKTM